MYKKYVLCSRNDNVEPGEGREGGRRWEIEENESKSW